MTKRYERAAVRRRGQVGPSGPSPRTVTRSAETGDKGGRPRSVLSRDERAEHNALRKYRHYLNKRGLHRLAELQTKTIRFGVYAWLSVFYWRLAADDGFHRLSARRRWQLLTAEVTRREPNKSKFFREHEPDERAVPTILAWLERARRDERCDLDRVVAKHSTVP